MHFRILFVLAVVFAILRLLWLDADPAGFIVADYQTDEGWYSQGARNKYLFGNWILDESNISLVLCPLYTFALYLSYSIFDVSFWSTRIVGAVSSVLTILLVGFRFRNQPKIAAFASLIIATQPILFALSRVAFVESFQLFFITLTWYFASDNKQRWQSWFFAGIASGLVMTSKGSAIYAPIFALAAPLTLLKIQSLRQCLKNMGWVILGGGIILIALIIYEYQFFDLFLLESQREGSRVAGLYGFYQMALLFLTDKGFYHPGFWLTIFPFIVFFGLACSRLLLTLPVVNSNYQPIRIAALWIFFSFIILCFSWWYPIAERYWANLIVPMSVIGAYSCSQREDMVKPRGILRKCMAAFLLILGPVVIFRSFIHTTFKSQFPTDQHSLRVFELLLSFIIIGIFLIPTYYYKLAEKLARLNVIWPWIAMAIITWGSVVILSIFWNPTYTLRDASRSIYVPGTAKVLTGDNAHTMALETPYYAFLSRNLAVMGMGEGWVNENWKALGATHWIIDFVPENPDYTPDPEATLETSYPIWPDHNGRPRLIINVFKLPE